MFESIQRTTLIMLLGLMTVACSQTSISTVAALDSAQLEQLKDPDYDGVIRQRDLCERTAAGALVNVDGCSSAQVQQFKSVYTVQFYRADVILACEELRGLLALIKHFQLRDDPIRLTIFAHQLPQQPALDLTLFEARAAYLTERLWAEYRQSLPPIEVQIETVAEDSYFIMNANQIGVRAYNLASGEVMRWHIYSMEGREGTEVEEHSASGW